MSKIGKFLKKAGKGLGKAAKAVGSVAAAALTVIPATSKVGELLTKSINKTKAVQPLNTEMATIVSKSVQATSQETEQSKKAKLSAVAGAALGAAYNKSVEKGLIDPSQDSEFNKSFANEAADSRLKRYGLIALGSVLVYFFVNKILQSKSKTKVKSYRSRRY